MSARPARAHRPTFCQTIPAGHGAGWPQDRLPKSDTAAPRIRQNGPMRADLPTRQRADLQVCVELRGFEPLTPSMRTRCATGLRYSPKNVSQPSKRPGLLARRASGPSAWFPERSTRGRDPGGSTTATRTTIGVLAANALTAVRRPSRRGTGASRLARPREWRREAVPLVRDYLPWRRWLRCLISDDPGELWRELKAGQLPY